ncbi:microtubule-associated protein futsch-like [Plakobranchus ocellatus]|uniref:Microtubule-associated protein futsch-like n=1 Tax=Plakobranchus ocellatus TaxID=259542 RepID=A0AAV4B2C9_9GAST|nr:microtubule-associated protein futsch-like [Plakobranchus ocellatus]
MDSDEQGSAAPGAVLLLIIGEPFSDEHKDATLAEVTKGFKCWDVEETGININEELAQIANRASLGEDGANGEKLIQHQSENLAVEILINPLAQSVKTSIKKLLIASSPTKYIIYAGHAFQGSGAWVLQDDTFAFSNLAQVLKNVEVETALKQNFEANLTIHTPVADSSWGSAISRADATNNLRIQLNPPSRLENVHGVVQFLAYVSSFIKVVPISSLLQASEQFGNISFTRPTLYIFPGCQGDSALFGISGFNLLVNGGYNRRACFWDFARHLDRVDAMLMTHLDSDNLFGLSAVLQRKTLDNIHPQIGYLYFNAIDKPGALSPQSDAAGEGEKKPCNLLINLSEEANKMTQMAKQLGISPHPCVHNAAAATCEPVNLYHKLGHGSLDMYVLNPVADTKELKEFFQAWSKKSPTMGNSGPFPLQHAMSVCTLLVWKPYNYDEKIVRIFFPGNCPQHKVIEGLEKMKAFGFLKHATCSTRDLMKPVSVKKPTGKTGTSSSRTVAKSSKPENGRAGLNSSRVDSTRKTNTSATNKSSAPSATPAASRTSVRASKEETAKKNVKTQDKTKPDDKEKKAAATKAAPSRPTSARPSSATNASAKGATSPRKPTSPTKAQTSKSPSPPKASSPAKSPSKSPSPPKVSSPTKSAPKADEQTPAKAAEPVPVAENLDPSIAASNHVDQQPESDQGRASAPQDQVEALQSVPDCAVDPMITSVTTAADPQKLAELGLISDLQKPQTNGGGDNFEAEEEEVKPQALPEPPVMIESPGQEQVGLPDYSSKIESDEQELNEFSKAEEELQVLAGGADALSFTDPAQEIPPSPEPSQRDQQEDHSPHDIPVSSSFETPVFSHDGAELGESDTRQEQNIQYGIDENFRGHDMGGIQEVDEEEHEEDANESKESVIMTSGVNANQKLDKEVLQEMGIYDDEDEQADADEEEISSDCRNSAERQFEDYEDTPTQEAVDEGIGEEDSSLPAAFERDSSPETVDSAAKGGNKDSIDGLPDNDKSVDEATPPQINGNGTYTNSQQNPFIGVSGADEYLDKSLGKQQHGSNDDLGEGTPFDPVAQWGQPMGLPSPPPPASDRKNGAMSPQKSRPASALNKTSARNGTEPGDAPKKRPATAPASNRGTASRPGTASSRRPGTAGSSRSSPAQAKVPALPPMTPFYVDLTYIPNHGDPAYSDSEFFKRVRARYYVISSMFPSPQVLDALLEAKATWEQKDLEVTLIPTYDNETLRHWMGLNKERLQELRVDMTPAVSRCTIQLQDLETSLPAYRLEV